MKKKVNDFLCEEETYAIRGACFKVWKEFAGAFKESVINKALLKELNDHGLNTEYQKRIRVTYKGEDVGLYIPDLIVNNSVLIELKCKPILTVVDRRQFWYYLKASAYPVGLLINFGPANLEIVRRVYQSARGSSA